MFPKQLGSLVRFGVVVAFTVAASGFAVAGGGGGGGGGHGGGGGGGHGGGYGGGGYGGGGYGHGGYGGYGHGGYGGYGYGGFGGYGYGGFGYGLGYYGAFGPYYGYDYGYPPYYGSAPAGAGPVVIYAQGNNAPAGATTDATAIMTVSVPSRDAVVLLNGTQTQQTDLVRRYQTPALTPGKEYAYEIQVKWTENGRPMEQSRTVSIQAGSRLNVDLTKSTTAVTDSVAHLTVSAPTPDAQLWLNGSPTTQKGASRQFKSPELTPGKKYSYEVRARWMEDGQAREATKTVVVEAGSQLKVDLSASSVTAAK